MKSDIFKSILEAVSKVCEISEEEILSSKRNCEILQARTLLVWFSFDYGIPPNDLAKYLHRKRAASIYAYRANYYLYRKMSTSFRILVQEISKILSIKIPSTIS